MLACIVYWPGVSGPFLFDDFASLPQLGDFGGVTDWEALRIYLFSGTTGPTGRPIALLSFLLNDTAWPSRPESFKYTNLMLHLLTGVLLFSLLRGLVRTGSGGSEGRANWIALLAAAVWLLHPLNVSTVLYVVQRMTILSALFVLAGLAAYVHGRQLLQLRPRAGYAWMSLALAGGTVLATFSKENGALLPLLALVIEYTALRSPRSNLPRPDRRWTLLFLWLPSLLLLGYLLYPLMSGRINAHYATRPFTVAERLLTEPRVLFDYLYYWFVPRIDSPGLLTQDFPLSHGWLDPPTALVSVLALAGLLLAGLLLRRTRPLISMSLLFFLAGHVMESTIIPLELYFEHRNYLPAVFLMLPPALGVVWLTQRRHVWALAGLLMVLVPAGLTAERARVWSDEVTLALQWARVHPLSQRAQRNAALVLEKRRRPDLAIALLDQAQQRMPDDSVIRLHRLTLECRYLRARPQDIEETVFSLRTYPFNFRSYKMLESLVGFFPSAACRGVTAQDVHAMFDALEENPKARGGGPRRQLFHLRGLLLLIEERADEAARMFARSQKARPDIVAALAQTALLASHGAYAFALEHLDSAAALLKKRPHLQGVGTLEYDREIVILRRNLIEAQTSPTGNTTPPESR